MTGDTTQQGTSKSEVSLKTSENTRATTDKGRGNYDNLIINNSVSSRSSSISNSISTSITSKIDVRLSLLFYPLNCALLCYTEKQIFILMFAHLWS